MNSELFSSDDETDDAETEIWPDSERVSFGNSAVPIFAGNIINENIR